jgi:hypothetical protein
VFLDYFSRNPSLHLNLKDIQNLADLNMPGEKSRNSVRNKYHQPDSAQPLHDGLRMQ